MLLHICSEEEEAKMTLTRGLKKEPQRLRGERKVRVVEQTGGDLPLCVRAFGAEFLFL